MNLRWLVYNSIIIYLLYTLFRPDKPEDNKLKTDFLKLNQLTLLGKPKWSQMSTKLIDQVDFNID